MLYGNEKDRSHAGARIAALEAAGKQVIVIRTVPGIQAAWPIKGQAQQAPECVERSLIDDACAWNPPSTADWLVEAATVAGAPVIDTWEILCADATCHTLIGGTIAYFDDNHLATAFAESLAPWLRNQLVGILN